MFLRLLMTGWLLYSGYAFATDRPIEEKARIGLDVGIQKEVILSRIDAQPINFNNNDIQPPLITVKGSYQPNYKSVFQPDAKLAISLLDGNGQHVYAQAGGWFDYKKWHLFFGGEYFLTLSGGDWGVSPADAAGAGGYIAGGIPLGIFYPKIEIRYRKVNDAEVANREGLSTRVDHDGDYLYRPSLIVDLKVVELWGAYTHYRIGNTAIASEGFGVGIDESTINIISLGVGVKVSKAKIWFKAHQVTGIKDELAHYYQVPQIYPDFLMAKQTAVVEALWQF